MDPQSRAIFREKDLKILNGGFGIGDDYNLYGPGASPQPEHSAIMSQLWIWGSLAVVVVLAIFINASKHKKHGDSNGDFLATSTTAKGASSPAKKLSSDDLVLPAPVTEKSS